MYTDGDYRIADINKGDGWLSSVGKVFSDVGTKLGLKELNISEGLGYKTRDEKIAALTKYKKEILDKTTKEDKPVEKKPEVKGEAISSPEATETPFNKQIQQEFGDNWINATRVLKRKTKNGKVVGENTQLGTGADLDYTNTDGTVDRGLFRINSRHFEPSEMKRRKKKLDAVGIKSFDDMLDPEKNIKMAKILYEEQGWDAWVAAPEELLSEKEKNRRKEVGVQIIE